MRNNELMHFKYKRKYKKNGKWIYIYNDGSSSEHSLNGLGNYTTSKYDMFNSNGKVTHVTKTTKTNTNKWFDSKSISTIHNSKFDLAYETIEYGKLHVARMNTARKLHTLSEAFTNAGKAFINRLKEG